MSCIGRPREAAPILHEMYAKRLLEPGWAGDLAAEEAAYIAGKLSKSSVLRRSWRVGEFFGKRWKHLTPAMVLRLGRWWAAGCPLATSKTLSPPTDRDDERAEQDMPFPPSEAVLARLQGAAQQSGTLCSRGEP